MLKEKRSFMKAFEDFKASGFVYKTAEAVYYALIANNGYVQFNGIAETITDEWLVFLQDEIFNRSHR